MEYLKPPTTQVAGMPRPVLYIAKPIFGPHMSPAIFQDKWLSKFRTIYNEITNSVVFVPLEAASHLLQQHAYLDQFDLESQCLRLKKSSFPELTPAASSEITQDYPGKHEVEIGEAFLTDNPFTLAEQYTFSMDWYLERFQEMKLGREYDGAVWRDLPLGVRKKVNDVLEIRAKQVEAGTWPITEEIRKTINSQMNK